MLLTWCQKQRARTERPRLFSFSKNKIFFAKILNNTILKNHDISRLGRALLTLISSLFQIYILFLKCVDNSDVIIKLFLQFFSS